MLTFVKAQVSAIIGSAADFLVFVVLVQITSNTPGMVALATAEGAITGGILNFLISRKWVFNEGQKSKRIQFFRYVLVWTGSILLNTSGMYLVTYYTTINHTVARLLVSVVVGVTYNYSLQKRFVFK